MVAQKDEFRIRYESGDNGSLSRYHSNIIKTYLVEQRPHTQLVHVAAGGASRWIELPWVYYVVTLNKHLRLVKGSNTKTEDILYPSIAKLFLRKTRTNSLNGYAMGAPLPNLSFGINPCFRSAMTPLDSDEQTCIAKAINTWWEAKFNHDYIDYVKDNPAYIFMTKNYSLGLSAMFRYWETLSQEEVMSLPYAKLTYGDRALRISDMLALSKEQAATKLIDRKIAQ